MAVADIARDYFTAEKQLGYALVGLGVVLLVAALWVWRAQAGAFAWSILVPLALIGVAGLGQGVMLSQRSAAQAASLPAQYVSAPAAAIAQEQPRMAKVNANWARLKAAWTGLTVIALVLLMAVRHEWSAGLGLSLLAFALIAFTIDVFAERRAQVYGDAIEAAARALGP